MSWRKAWKRIKKAAKDAADDVVEGAKEGADSAWEAAKDLAQDVEDEWDEFTDNVKDSWNKAEKTIRKGMDSGGFLGGLAGLIVGLGAFVLNFGGDLAGATFGFQGAIFGGLADIAFSIGGGLISFAGGLLSGTLKVIGGTIAGIIDLLGGDGDGMYEAWSFIAELAFEFSRVLGSGIATIGGGFTKSVVYTTYDSAGGMARLLPKAVATYFFIKPFDVIICTFQSKRNLGRNQKIDHFFVLMLENRSYDHMFGYAEFNGAEQIKGKETSFVNYDPVAHGGHIAGNTANDTIDFDPPHEFIDVQIQIFNSNKESDWNNPKPPMNGFIYSVRDKARRGESEEYNPRHPERVLDCFTPKTLPVLHTLGQYYVVCDHWFASVPGPTLPNRLFLYACSSGGLASSPKKSEIASAIAEGINFEHGTLFDLFEEHCREWRVYHGDPFPLVLTLKGVDDRITSDQDFREFGEQFENDLREADRGFPNLILIEPDYGKFWGDFTTVSASDENASSQHPLASVKDGEEFIKRVYKAIRGSPIWKKSALIITYDEHGGFFDHVAPPKATPPGDDDVFSHANSEDEAKDFKFDRLGVRVPALIISPWVEKGCADHTVYDHTSVTKSMVQNFGFRRNLTNRDTQANDFLHVFSLDIPRDDDAFEE